VADHRSESERAFKKKKNRGEKEFIPNRVTAERAVLKARPVRSSMRIVA
jgi:hypothetical protein